MYLSNYLSKATKKAQAKKFANMPKATEIKQIGELVNVINGTEKRHMNILQLDDMCDWNNVSEYSDIGADVKGGFFYIFDKANPSSKLVILHMDAVRAYHENDKSISIYPHQEKHIGADKFFRMIALCAV